MHAPPPHFLLLSESHTQESGSPRGRWRFLLEPVGRRPPGVTGRLDVRDSETGVTGERLALLAVVRGLEALTQPSRVTLITSSNYVLWGVRFGLSDWRDASWRWERHGEMVPIKHADLWQRLDRALQIHQVRIRGWQFSAGPPASESSAPSDRLSWRRPPPRHTGHLVMGPVQPVYRWGVSEQTFTNAR